MKSRVSLLEMLFPLKAMNWKALAVVTCLWAGLFGAAKGEEEPAAGPPEDREEALRVQILLDQKHFGPGYLDGRIGSFSKKAGVCLQPERGALAGGLGSLAGGGAAGGCGR